MVSSANNKAACGRFNPSTRHPAALPNEVLLRQVALISRGLIFEVATCCQGEKRKNKSEMRPGTAADCICRHVQNSLASVSASVLISEALKSQT